MATRLTATELLALPAVVDFATAAAALGMSRSMAYALARADRFPVRYYRVGRHYRVRTADLLAYLNVPPPNGPGAALTA